MMKKSFKYPTIYEINTRVWLKRFSARNGSASFSSVPDEYWANLKSLGIDYVWLMGVWRTNPEIVERYCFEDFLRDEYTRALPDWKKDDVIGSPYSIDSYTVSPTLGGEEELLKLKASLNERGLGLVLDFIPNHFSSGSSLLREKPEIFIQGNETDLGENPNYFFRDNESGKIFANGRDPFFPAWRDTAQLNYFREETHEFMKNTMLDISKICDGLRCDMAMLVLNNVFANTWKTRLQNSSGNESEFWKTAVDAVKSKNESFLFIAESYWNLEWNLQQLGFDFTYDKKLTDRLTNGFVPSISGHLDAEPEFRDRSLRFIENHDEERAAAKFGKERSQAAAVVISTVPGMRFFYDGQFEGKQIKLPVQLGREPDEFEDSDLREFYQRLLTITNSDLFKNGTWQKLQPLNTSESDKSAAHILAWQWTDENSAALAAINFSGFDSYCFLKFDPGTKSEVVNLHDELNDLRYIRNADEIRDRGLFVKLEPFQSHIFKF